MFRERYPERGEIYARFDAESAAMRQSATTFLDVPYGQHPRCKFDLFPAAKSAPLVVFIHGGYWQSLSKDRYSFIARPLIDLDYSVAVLGYPLAPDMTVTQINANVLSGLTEIIMWLGRQNSIPGRMIVTGHSAGGHLATCAALQWSGRMPAITALMPISAIFDLEPIIHTSLNQVLGLDTAAAKASSPISQPPPTVPVIAFVGGAETEGFILQSRNYVDHCNATGSAPAKLIRIGQANHYSVLLDFLQPDSKIVGKIDDHMNLRG